MGAVFLEFDSGRALKKQNSTNAVTDPFTLFILESGKETEAENCWLLFGV